MEFIEHLCRSAFQDFDYLNTVNGNLTGYISKDFIKAFRDNLKRIHKKVNRKIVIANVGACDGLSAITMVNVARQCQIQVVIVCIDTWLDWHLYCTFLKNIVDNGMSDDIAPFRIPSNEAVEVFNHINIKPDMVYVNTLCEIDDIKRLWTIVNNDGCIFGDDYLNKKLHYVDTFCQNNGLKADVNGVNWSIVKPWTT